VAEDSTSKRRIKKVATVRERAATQPSVSKRRRLRKTAGSASRVFRPLRFLAVPLRFRPIRKVGRLIGLVLFPRFFRNAFKELRQVEWPDWRQTSKLTFAVIIFAVGFGLLIALTDYGLDIIFKKGILK
jgi:preprotein translocase SecE subunit